MDLNEQQTKNTFINNLTKLLPEIKASVLKLEKPTEAKKIDLTLKIQIGNIQKILVCELKAKGEPRYIYQAITKIKYLSRLIENSIPVIIAPHISSKSQEICREFQVNYIDLTGNIWLTIDSITIEKEGKKYTENKYRHAKNIFATKSSRIIKKLLLNYKEIMNLEEISSYTETSLSYVHRIIKTLEKRGYVKHKKREGVKLVRPEALLLEWANNYNVFKDNEVSGFYTFKTESSDIIKQINDSINDKLNYALTLFSGSQFILPFVRHTTFYVYFNKEDTEYWIDKLQLKHVEEGPNFYILNPYDDHIYWGTQKINGVNITSNIQLFLDLYNFPARGEEQAMMLKKEKIKFE